MNPILNYHEPISFNHPLTPNQWDLLNNPYRESSIKVGEAYLKDDPKRIVKVLFNETTFLKVASLVALIFITATVGGVFAEMTNFSTDDEGIIMGGIVGGTLVSFSMITSSIKAVTSSSEYMQWNASHVQLVVNRSIENTLKKDEVLNRLFCPLSNVVTESSIKLKEEVNNACDDQALKGIKKYSNKSCKDLSLMFNKKLLQFDSVDTSNILKRLDSLIEQVESVRVEAFGGEKIYQVINLVINLGFMAEEDFYSEAEKHQATLLGMRALKKASIFFSSLQKIIKLNKDKGFEKIN